MKSCETVLLTVLACAGALCAQANTTWHPNRVMSTSSPQWFTNMQYWATAGGDPGSGAPTVSDDLFFAGYAADKRLRFTGTTFAGNSFQLGENGAYAEVVHDSGTMTFQNEGLILDKGAWWFNPGGQGATLSVSGPVTVNSAPEYPFTFHFGQTQLSNGTANISGPISGAAGKSLVFGPCPWWGRVSARNSTFALSDLDGYAGGITVTSTYENAGAEFGTLVRLGTTTNACSIDVWRGGSISTINATDAARVGSIIFHPGSRLTLKTSETQGLGTIHATGKVTVEGGPVPVRFAGIVRGSAPYRIAILAGSAESTFTADDFTLDHGAPGQDYFYNLDAHLEVGVDEATHLRTLYFGTCGFVYQTANTGSEITRDNSATTGSSLTNAAAWWDGLTPHGGSSYRTAMALRTLNAPNEDTVFPGESLWLQGGHLRLTVRSFSVPVLYVSSSGSIGVTQGKSGYVGLLANQFRLLDSTTTTIYAYNYQELVLDGELSGAGSILMLGWAGTGAPKASYEFRGVNTNFTGAVKVTQDEYRAEYISFDSKFPTLVVNDGRNLGGKRPEFDPRALTLTHMARLSVTSDAVNVTLAGDLNRGVYVLEKGRFNVAKATSVLDVEQPVLLSGKLWKEGPGTLVLGGALKHEDDGGALSDIPRAGSNLVEILAGTVKVGNANALAGAETTLAAGTKLAVDYYDAQNADLSRYGLKNTATDTPFVLAAGLNGKLPLFAVSSAPAPEAIITLGLITVRDSAAVAVRNMMPSSIPRIWPDVSQRMVEIHDDANNWTTFALEAGNRGTIIMLR